MARLRLLAFVSTLAACAGLPAPTHPLFVARPADSTAASPAAPAITVETNSIVFTAPAGTVTGCFDLAGEYVRKGNDLEVTLKQVAAAATCNPEDRRPYISRIGPLSPGSYQVSVVLDGKSLIRGERVQIR